MTIIAVNPATGRTLAEYRETTPDEILGAIDAAHAAFREWRRTSFEHREIGRAHV